MLRTSDSKRGKQAFISISRQVWEWAKANPRYEEFMQELEDLEDLRREKAKKEKSVPLADVLKEYEFTHRIQLAR